MNFLRVCRNHGLPFEGPSYSFAVSYDSHSGGFLVDAQQFCSLACTKTFLCKHHPHLLDTFVHFAASKYNVRTRVLVLADPGVLHHFRADGQGVSVEEYLSSAERGVVMVEATAHTTPCVMNSELVEFRYAVKGLGSEYSVVPIDQFPAQGSSEEKAKVDAPTAQLRGMEISGDLDPGVAAYLSKLSSAAQAAFPKCVDCSKPCGAADAVLS